MKSLTRKQTKVISKGSGKLQFPKTKLIKNKTTMNKFVAIFAATLAVVATVALASPNYGSYVTTCNQATQEVTFHNYKEQNCGGDFTNFSKPLGGCHPELLIFSWNAFCNGTHQWYNNFKNRHCGGDSVLTRTYVLGKCFNCPNKECKNP